MRAEIKKVLLSALSLMLTVMMIAGIAEVVEMSGGPAVSVSVLASAGDPTPAPSGGGSSSSGSSSSGYTKSSKKTVKNASNKKLNTMTVSGKTVDVSAVTLASKSKTISRKNVVSVKKAKGKVTYKKVKGNKKIKVYKKTGKIKLKKGLKPGTYKIKVRIHASGTSKYRGRSRTVKITIKVHKAENPLSAQGNTVEIDKNSLDEGDLVVNRGDALALGGYQGALSYSKISGSRAINVDTSTGAITVGKGFSEGSYKVEVGITAAGNSLYNAKTVKTTVTVVVKAFETEQGDNGSDTGAGDEGGSAVTEDSGAVESAEETNN